MHAWEKMEKEGKSAKDITSHHGSCNVLRYCLRLEARREKLKSQIIVESYVERSVTCVKVPE